MVSFLKISHFQISHANLTAGLHFLPDAYRLMYESMMELIRSEWPDQDPESMCHVFPAWTEAPR